MAELPELDVEHQQQPAPNFIFVVIWAILAILCLIALLMFVLFVFFALNEQRETGFIVFLGSLALLSAGSLFVAVKKCARVYLAYDAAQRT